MCVCSIPDFPSRLKHHLLLSRVHSPNPGLTTPKDGGRKSDVITQDELGKRPFGKDLKRIKKNFTRESTCMTAHPRELPKSRRQFSFLFFFLVCENQGPGRVCVAGAGVSGDPELDWVPNSLSFVHVGCVLFFCAVGSKPRPDPGRGIARRCECQWMPRAAESCCVAKPTPVYNNTIDRIESKPRKGRGRGSDHAKNPYALYFLESRWRCIR